MSSSKTKVIEIIFADPERWSAGALIKRDVTFHEVQSAIRKMNNAPDGPKRPLSDRNPANFFKDLLRKHKSLVDNWPESVRSKGYYGEQAKGEELCFRFIDFDPSIHAILPPPPYLNLELAVHNVQTLSINRLNKALARNDENWLMAISTAINIPQIHFTIHEIDDWSPVSLNHVQSNMKLFGAEIDGVFLMEEADKRLALVCIEAKGFNDNIIESQIFDQVKAAQKVQGFKRLTKMYEKDMNDIYIIPAALKVYKVKDFPLKRDELAHMAGAQSILYFVHYQPIHIDQVIYELSPVAAQTAFILKPAIAGL